MKGTHDRPLSFRLASDEYDWLQRLADDVGRSMSMLVRLALRRLKRDTLPRGWVRDAEIERSVGRPR
jgi:predicted transcriptional regulator